MSSEAEISWVGGSAPGRGATLPGQAWPPPTTVVSTTSAPSVPPLQVSRTIAPLGLVSVSGVVAQRSCATQKATA
jgi:hypothetical protein